MRFVDNAIVEKGNTSLSIREFAKPEIPFGFGIYNNVGTKIYYISDIHLIHHLDSKTKQYFFRKYDEINNKEFHKDEALEKAARITVKKIVKNLFNDAVINDIIFEDGCNSDKNKVLFLFGGDISSDSELTKCFYREFRNRYQLTLFKEWKEKFRNELPVTRKEAAKKFSDERRALKEKKKKLIERISKWYRYTKKSEELAIYEIEKAVTPKPFVPSYFNIILQKIRSIEDALLIDYEDCSKDLYISKALFGNKYEKMNVFPIYAILGNHELQDYCTLKSAKNDFADFFRELGFHFLNNGGFKIPIGSKDLFIIGGIGFAKYNEKYNCKTLLNTTPSMKRKEEIIESDALTNLYEKVLKNAKEEGIPLVVLSHYPIEDWLGEDTESLCTFFTGHTHSVYKHSHTKTLTLYNDNQIGYKKTNISFKTCRLGMYYNPFYSYKDGCYEVDPEKYMMFLRYTGEIVSGVGNVKVQIDKYNCKLYMLKRSGFYTFIVINPKTGAKICKGGSIKSISKTTDIEYFNRNFIKMVSVYAGTIAPYRQNQEKIAEIIKKYGGEGKIHGCIIDYNFDHHVLFNPFDGEVILYYSPRFGEIKPLESFEKLLESASKTEFSIEAERNRLLLKADAEKGIVAFNEYKTSKVESEDLVKISPKDSVYAVSNRLNQLQRLFDTNVLRDWDDELLKKQDVNHSHVFQSKDILMIDTAESEE